MEKKFFLKLFSILGLPFYAYLWFSRSYFIFVKKKFLCKLKFQTSRLRLWLRSRKFDLVGSGSLKFEAAPEPKIPTSTSDPPFPGSPYYHRFARITVMPNLPWRHIAFMNQTPTFYIEIYEQMKRSQSSWITQDLITWTKGITVPTGFTDLGMIMAAALYTAALFQRCRF